MQSSNEKVNEFLVDLQSTLPNKFETVEEIRKIFFSENPEIIEFSHGAQFTDTDGFLEGKGKLRRHLKILNINDVKNKTINIYIKQSVSN